MAKSSEIADTSPVEILWSFDPDSKPELFVHSPEQVTKGEYREGAVREILVNVYERNRTARQACVDHFGAVCSVCDLCFEKQYGLLGTGFIHIHHMVPLSEIGPNYQVNPLEDLRPVCPNCHAMLHRRRPPLSIEELRTTLQQNRKDDRAAI
jgi:5-methylcytosine-specific restriction enzyme A